MRFGFVFSFLVFVLTSFAQKLPSVEEKVNGLKHYPGFFDLYWDESSGKLYLDIDKLDSQVLYVTSLPAGLGSNDIGLDRGLLGDTKIVKFSRIGRKVLMVQPNYNFRAITSDKNEEKAAHESFATSVIWGFTVEAESNGHQLVDATDFLLRDAMQAANRIRSLRQGNYVFDKSRSALYLPSTKNFPFNTEIETTITLVNNDGITGNYLQQVTPSTEAISLRMHHSFVRLPDNNYEPRIFDARSSYIPISYFDYSTPVSEPIEKYFIIRHRLRKKDPNAAKSEPVEPIVYYLDNGTPEPVRSALLEGARWWNQAFEAAGYINAFQVKLLPDSADPMDIRYNMINWVHRSTRGWSYGAAVVDPRTGEIIKGNVTLGSLRVRQDYLIATGLLAPYANGIPADDKMQKMALARLRQLAAHEVGHTLGLMHNYAASKVNRSSVMDYPPPVVKLNDKGEIDLSDAYSTGIGEWDKISISYGYTDFPKGTDEKQALNSILETATQRGMLYISDRDARDPGGLHPYAHLWDNGSNATSELLNVMKVREKALNQFGENNIKPGMPMAMLEDVLVPVYLYHRYQLEAVSKLVGGMNYSYALRGDHQLITQPIKKEEQMKALDALIYCIQPSQLALPERILSLIPPRPAGYGFTRELFKKRTGLAFDGLMPAETVADLTLSLLFNSARLNRLAQFDMENNGLGLKEMIAQLIDKTWKQPRKTKVEGLIQIQTEQILLTYLLSALSDDNNSYVTKSIIRRSIEDLKSFIESRLKTSNETYSGHLYLALDRIKNPEKAKPTIPFEMPPGAPIGMDEEMDQ